jgi:hypothetical protein
MTTIYALAFHYDGSGTPSLEFFEQTDAVALAEHCVEAAGQGRVVRVGYAHHKPDAEALDVRSGHESHACGGNCGWHHSDEALTFEDRAGGDQISEKAGVILIDGQYAASLQWALIAKALRLHGLRICAMESAK